MKHLQKIEQTKNQPSKEKLWLREDGLYEWKLDGWYNTVTDEILHLSPAKKAPWLELVDLHLPSDLKWAKINIGADTTNPYGFYFTHDGSETIYTINDLPDNMMCIRPTDVATEVCGKKYRIPTIDEFTELLNNTKVTYVVGPNGEDCAKFTSVSDENKYIYLTLSGYATTSKDERGTISDGYYLGNNNSTYGNALGLRLATGTDLFTDETNIVTSQPINISKGIYSVIAVSNN